MSLEYEALEADWLHHYRRDLRLDLWGPEPMGIRRLVGLFTNLPPGCAVHRRQDPDGAGADWRNREELLATLIEVVDLADRNFVAAHSKRGARKPKPINIRRPHELRKRRERRPATGTELAATFKRLGAPMVPGGVSSNGGRD